MLFVIFGSYSWEQYITWNYLGYFNITLSAGQFVLIDLHFDMINFACWKIDYATPVNFHSTNIRKRQSTDRNTMYVSARTYYPNSKPKHLFLLSFCILNREAANIPLISFVPNLHPAHNIHQSRWAPRRFYWNKIIRGQRKSTMHIRIGLNFLWRVRVISTDMVY